MIVGFIIWSILALCFIGIGIWAWNSKTAVGFFAGVTPPKVKDVKKYNHSVSILWIVYAILFEAFGVPFLFLEQNSAGFVIPVAGTVVISLGLAIAYSLIESKYR